MQKQIWLIIVLLSFFFTTLIMINEYCRKNTKLIENVEGFIADEKEKLIVHYKNPQKAKFPDSIKGNEHVDESGNIAHLSHNKSSPECCPSTYSTDRGCLCMTEAQKKQIVHRGRNNLGDDRLAQASGLYQDV